MSVQVSEGSSTNDAIDEPSLQIPRRRAKVWEHFEHELAVVEGVPKAVCKYCKLKLAYTNKTGTNRLRNHIAESSVGKYCKFFFQKVCDNEDDIDKNIESTKDWMKRYFEKYEQLVRRNGEDPVSHTSEARNSVGSPVLGKKRVEEEFVQYMPQRRVRRREPKSELDRYLEEEFDLSNDNFDILGWWKKSATKYPVLSAMVRDFLAIHLSTVCSESAFSCSGRILGDTRSSLSPETLEALVCTKDWLIKVPNTEDGA